MCRAGGGGSAIMDIVASFKYSINLVRVTLAGCITIVDISARPS